MRRGAIGMRAQRDSCGAEKHGPVASHGRRLAAGFLFGIMNGPGTLVPAARPSRLQPEDLRRDGETALCESPDGDTNTSQPRRSSRRLRRNATIASNDDAPSTSCSARLHVRFQIDASAPGRQPYFTRQRVATIACASARSSYTYCPACRFVAVRRTASQCCARMPTTTHTAIPKRTDIKKPAHVARAGSTIAATATALRPSPPRAHLR
ncbi:hypothetical protein AK36_1919 [Burkholderia vietnamiensis LMG 10929]|nr:hypothetical protein AK36_1919 [Burkholderia vietnamiensis LMG 10929]